MLGFFRSIFSSAPETPEQEFGRLWSAFAAGARGAGMNDESMRHELMFRAALVRLRRKVSAAAVKQPHKFWDYRREAAEAEGQILAVTNRKLGLEFVRFVLESSPEELLTPEAYATCLAAWERQHESGHAATIDSDMLEALR